MRIIVNISKSERDAIKARFPWAGITVGNRGKKEGRKRYYLTEDDKLMNYLASLRRKNVVYSSFSEKRKSKTSGGR